MADEITRRQTVVAGLAGAAALAHPKRRKSMSEPMPVAFLPHGGGPWPFISTPLGDPDELAGLATYLKGISAVPRTPPKALLVVSAHWEERVPTVMSAERPPMLYDYSGFPPESYTLQWPAPGNPALAAQVRELLGKAGFQTASDERRGYDHGTFVPLMLAFPAADIPTVQLSLKRGLDPAEHLAMGRALAPLRDEGVYILGSGMTFHNLRAFGPAASGPSEQFDAWLRDAVLKPSAERERALTEWAKAPAARQVHPREEHLLPLMVAAGAARGDRGTHSYTGTLMGVRHAGFQFGG